ncbi:unnamed protein product [Amoebophrya sp. A120]|nr:unnamed protein product [Amoebophrya sp. A120]|eukprot:GSA120T00019424001.1
MTRIDRYPLLPGVFASVYPNPKSETAHDTSKSDPAPPPNAKCSAADVAAMVAKLEHAAPVRGQPFVVEAVCLASEQIKRRGLGAVACGAGAEGDGLYVAEPKGSPGGFAYLRKAAKYVVEIRVVIFYQS